MGFEQPRTDLTTRIVVDEARRLLSLRGAAYAALYMYRFGVPPAIVHRVLGDATQRPAPMARHDTLRLPRHAAAPFDSFNI